MKVSVNVLFENGTSQECRKHTSSHALKTGSLWLLDVFFEISDNCTARPFHMIVSLGGGCHIASRPESAHSPSEHTLITFNDKWQKAEGELKCLYFTSQRKQQTRCLSLCGSEKLKYSCCTCTVFQGVIFALSC